MLLSVKQLRAWFRQQDRVIKAVDDVSFDIHRGETFCLVGESGSGKSITALSIMRLLPSHNLSCQDGEVRFQHEGARVNLASFSEVQMRQIRGGRIAMIFQEPMSSLNPVFSIGEQILEAVNLHFPELDEQAAWARVMQSLEEVQLPDPGTRVHSFPHQLSGGQRQRVMIAMAMACEPDLLIADEPTTALDVTVQREILRLMKALQARTGMAILFITHDFGVVSEIADRVGVMQRGKLVEVGAVDRLIRHPEHSYSKALIAALPENLARQASHVAVTESAPLVRLRNLQIHFPVRKGLFRRVVDQVRAVDGVDLEIPRGQILALVGESGSGKSTLGRGILRLTEPTAGQVAFDNTDITRLNRSELRRFRRHMQIIFQDPVSSLNPRLSIAGILTEPMKVHGIGENQEQRIEIARDLLDQVQMEADTLWRYPHEFSGGQRQRIGIARALCLNPAFIVCDEITSALDVSVQAEILKMLLQLRADRGLTLLFITHNIGVVDYVSDQTLVMYQGRIVEQGKTSDILNRPEQDYTKQLIAAVPRVRF